MRSFGTYGRVRPEQHYIVPRTTEVADFINRVKAGRYIVLFAPRQTGKTTFFRLALNTLTAEDPTYFPILLDFQTMRSATSSVFYSRFYQMICMQIESVFEKHRGAPSEALTQFLADTTLTDDFSMLLFFKQLASFLDSDSHKDVPAFKRVVLLIDEFDGIPKTVISNFLYSLRQIYLSDEMQCPYSVGIVGVRSIAQLNYDRSVSPFNIQDEFKLPNFTLEQVQELFQQYTNEMGQAFAPEVIASIHKQTAGQPFLVNRFGQILTEALDIPKTETFTMAHFSKAHAQLLEEDNTNLTHLITNIRRDRRFETLLMRITAAEESVHFSLRNELISALFTYGVITKGADGLCEILNPIYLYCILQTFKPLINGLEYQYLPEDTDAGFSDYLTPAGHIDLVSLLDNFRDFIGRAGFQILQVPDMPRESVGRHLLLAYLDQFVKLVGGVMHIEVQTGRGRMDLIITHNQRKYIVETKVWRGASRYQAGKKQLAAYLKLEGVRKGYYVVFGHRIEPEPRLETETVEGVKIRSYVIPVIQELPSTL
ncbi:MAG: AAA-like domain-containing protein [Candidatus Poribacteria bacterium]|nr:AAA-like domain-containing protein [Candidatus Poribacteria bacterium]